MQNTALIKLLREYDIFPDDPEIRELFGFLEDDYQQVIDRITAQQKDIIDLLNSSDLEIRLMAAHAIASIDKSKADLLIPTLIEGLKNETYWHYAADTCLILGPLAAPVVSTLIEILETNLMRDRDEKVFCCADSGIVDLAISILGDIGPDAKNAIPVLREYINVDGDDVAQMTRIDAGKAIWQITGDKETPTQIAEEMLNHQQEWVRSYAAYMLDIISAD
jgi:hypothetical protein